MHKNLRGLYAITDSELIPENRFEQQITEALAGGASIIQYRDKSLNHPKRLRQATLLRHLCNQYQALLIINDDIELCLSVRADGVHLGRDDNSIHFARTQLGNQAIIGASCYHQSSLAEQAVRAGADYIAFGAVFPSVTKPHAPQASLSLIEQTRKRFAIPVCAIGGINPDNASRAISAGVDMIAVINSLFAQPDIKKTARYLSGLFHVA